MQSVRNLIVWNLGMELVDHVYDASMRFPRDERFGVTQQLRRAVVSVPANIAEGAGRNSDREFRRYLLIAIGSLEEVGTYVELAIRRAWIAEEEAEPIRQLTDDLRAAIVQLIKRIERDLQSAKAGSRKLEAESP
ncbi:MAG: four helix bundle protein [Planctomycetota bacterium]|jgi:four helix bundle protein